MFSNAVSSFRCFYDDVQSILFFQRISKRATQKYISVATSEKEGDTGSFSLSITGPSKASVSNIDLTDPNPSSSDTNDTGNKVGVIVGSVVGGVIGLLCLYGLCCGIIGTVILCCCCHARPLHSNRSYVRRGGQTNQALGTALFQTGVFGGSASVDGAWPGEERMNLSFYPRAGFVLYGKGSDVAGAFAVHGVYSAVTLRMGFDKLYDGGRSETIQVEWDVNREVFNGHCYSKVNGRREKREYTIRKMRSR